MSIQEEETTGLFVVKDNLLIVNIALEGIERYYFDNLIKYSSLTISKLATIIGINPKTLNRYQRSQKKFTGAPAEKLLLLHRLFASNNELFTSATEFVKWLSIPSPGLNKQPPLTLLHSVTGIIEVEKHMQRLAHGYAA